MSSQKTRFWAGNAVLVGALWVLFNMGTLSRRYGMWAVVVWMALTALGFYLILSGKEPPGSLPK